MIFWLTQSLETDPDICRGRPPAGLLAEEEEKQFHRLKTEKRRRDWLLGRWTAKQLLRHVVHQVEGVLHPASAFVIGNRASGAPFVHQKMGMERPYTISISHSRGYAFCAVLAGAGRPLGADIEWCEPRSDGFVGDFFTAAEQSLVAAAPASSRDTLVTAIWSGKEAALKALRTGLRVDTRAVTCLISQEVTAEKWTPFPVRWAAVPDPGAEPMPALNGWWRPFQGFVLTLVASAAAGSEGRPGMG